MLVLMMEENKQHFQHIMLYYFKKSKNTTGMQKKICSVYREGAMTDQIRQKWFVKFHAGDCCWTTLHGWVEKLKQIAIK